MYDTQCPSISRASGNPTTTAPARKLHCHRLGDVDGLAGRRRKIRSLQSLSGISADYRCRKPGDGARNKMLVDVVISIRQFAPRFMLQATQFLRLLLKA